MELTRQRHIVVPVVIRPEDVDAARLTIDVSADTPHPHDAPVNYVLVDTHIEFVSAQTCETRSAQRSGQHLPVLVVQLHHPARRVDANSDGALPPAAKPL